jgi:hypothetical protein
MDLERSTYGELFALTFVIGGAFHAALVAVGSAIALLNPGVFHTGSQGNSVAAGTPLQALGVLLGMAIVALIANLIVSAGGATVVVSGRTLLGRKYRLPGRA